MAFKVDYQFDAFVDTDSDDDAGSCAASFMIDIRELAKKYLPHMKLGTYSMVHVYNEAKDDTKDRGRVQGTLDAG